MNDVDDDEEDEEEEEDEDEEKTEVGVTVEGVGLPCKVGEEGVVIGRLERIEVDVDEPAKPKAKACLQNWMKTRTRR